MWSKFGEVDSLSAVSYHPVGMRPRMADNNNRSDARRDSPFFDRNLQPRGPETRGGRHNGITAFRFFLISHAEVTSGALRYIMFSYSVRAVFWGRRR